VDAQFGDRLIAETEQMQSAVDGCVSQAAEDTYLWPAVCKAVGDGTGVPPRKDENGVRRPATGRRPRICGAAKPAKQSG
jgi:hypothetical protein